MIKLEESQDSVSCNFCTDKGPWQVMYELRSTNPHRISVIYACASCLGELKSLIDAPVTMPHCDARILHAPGSCGYCDDSGLQPVREVWNIAFTGAPEEGKTQCPAEAERDEESLAAWGGNVPQPTLESVAKHLEEKDGEEGQGGST